jgi:hypothetical protein
MTDEAMSPLRRRMIEDMTIRRFTSKTQHDYVQRVKNFAAFLGRSPDMRVLFHRFLAATFATVSTRNGHPVVLTLVCFATQSSIVRLLKVTRADMS